MRYQPPPMLVEEKLPEPQPEVLVMPPQPQIAVEPPELEMIVEPPQILAPAPLDAQAQAPPAEISFSFEVAAPDTGTITKENVPSLIQPN